MTDQTSITILGLGPGDPALLTREAWEVLHNASEVFLRTARHPTAGGLPSHLAIHSFDELYETADDFTQLYAMIASRVLELARRPGGVLYAVPGHPLVGETSVRLILNRARAGALGVRLVEGMSFVEPVLSMLELDSIDGLQLADATDLCAGHHALLDPDRPALIAQLYSRPVASALKLALMSTYPDDHAVTLVRAAGTGQGAMTSLLLYELDQGAHVDHLTTLYVPALPRVGGLPAFLETVARLRAPGGCPWDREQTHASLRPGLLQEAYEVLAALDDEDSDKLCEELGDLLMQIAMQAQIATEEGSFRFTDVIASIDSKLKRRHPHVFGDLTVSDSEQVLRNWEVIKAQERHSSVQGSEQPGQLEGLPVILPALARAQALGERAARVGFDWSNFGGVLDKVAEEVEELQSACDTKARAEELGDLLFTLVNVARWMQVDAESSLRSACNRFTRRYNRMERSAREEGIDLERLSQAELDVLWERAKTQ